MREHGDREDRLPPSVAEGLELPADQEERRNDGERREQGDPRIGVRNDRHSHGERDTAEDRHESQRRHQERHFRRKSLEHARPFGHVEASEDRAKDERHEEVDPGPEHAGHDVDVGVVLDRAEPYRRD